MPKAIEPGDTVIPEIGQTSPVAALLGRRDAFHVPSTLVSSGHIVKPGQFLKFAPVGQVMLVVPCEMGQADGVASPWIVNDITPGTVFWMLLKPGLASKLSHVFDINVPGGELTPGTTGQIDLSSNYEDEQDDDCPNC